MIEYIEQTGDFPKKEEITIEDWRDLCFVVEDSQMKSLITKKLAMDIYKILEEKPY